MSSHSSVPPSPQENPLSNVQEDKYPFDDEYFKASALPSDPWSQQQDATSAMISEIGSYEETPYSPYSSEAHESAEQEHIFHSQGIEIDREVEHNTEEDQLEHGIGENTTEPEEFNKQTGEFSWQQPVHQEKEDQQQQERSPSPISLNEEPVLNMGLNPLSENSENRETDITAEDANGRHSPIEKASNIMPSKEEIQFRQDSISSEDYFPLDGKVTKKVLFAEKRSPSPIEEIEESRTEKEGIHSALQESSPLELEFSHSSNVDGTSNFTAENTSEQIWKKHDIDFQETPVANIENFEEPAKAIQNIYEKIEDQPPNASKSSTDGPLPSIPEVGPPPQENFVMLQMKSKIIVTQDSQDSQTSPSEKEVPTITEKPPELQKPQLPPPIVKISAPAPEVPPAACEFKPTTTTNPSKITDSNATGSVKASDSIPMIDAEATDAVQPSGGTSDGQKSNETRRERITKGLRRLCCIL